MNASDALSFIMNFRFFIANLVYFSNGDKILELETDTPSDNLWKFSLLWVHNNSHSLHTLVLLESVTWFDVWTWMYYHDHDSQWREPSLLCYRNHLWEGGSTNPRGSGLCCLRGLAISGFNTSKPTTESLKNRGYLLTNYCLADYTLNSWVLLSLVCCIDLIYFSSHLAALNIPAVAGMPSYDAESIAGTAIFNRLLA